MARRIIAADRSTDGPLLQVEDLRTSFRTPRGRVRAVDGVSFALERGRTLGVVGESGSGKTVLSRSIMGLLPRSNVERSGTIRYDGTDISDYSQAEMRQVWGPEMAMIFQDPMTSLNPVMRIGKQITESLRFHLDMGKDEANDLAVALLQSVGIPEPARRVREYPHQLSGGMRQRAMIAMALICQPRILLADEPTTALDVTTQAQILALLRRLKEELGMSVVMITHDLGVVAETAQSVAVMYLGRVVETADVRRLFHDPKHPYTQAMLNSVPKMGRHARERLTPVKGMVPSPYNRPRGCPFHTRCPHAMPGLCNRYDPQPIPVGDGREVSCFLYGNPHQAGDA